MKSRIILNNNIKYNSNNKNNNNIYNKRTHVGIIVRSEKPEKNELSSKVFVL